MSNNDLAKNMLKLEILSQNACEGFSGVKKTLLTQKDKVLFLIGEYDKVSPTILINKLYIAKSNLALICKQLLLEKYIVATSDKNDRRIIYYTITDKGANSLEEKLAYIQNNTIACCKDNKKFEEQISDIVETLQKKF